MLSTIGALLLIVLFLWFISAMVIWATFKFIDWIFPG